MLGARHVATCLLLLGALALAAPAITLAAGGGSAGDQQYTDPFSGTQSHATSSTPAPTPTTSPPVTASPSSASGDPSTVTSTPTATTAATTRTAPGNTATTLPYTGYDSWVAGALGLVLLGSGISLRRRSRRA